MVKKLHFKGDPIKKKKVKSDKSGFKKEENSELDERADSNAWVRPNDASHIRGPTVLLHTQGPSVLVFNSTVKKPLIHSLPESDTIEAFTPDDISNVWVASTLSGTDTLTLRSADGKFLASDSLGSVTALREARGPNEQWRPIVQQDGSVALMSIYDKFLAQDETAGGQIILRADSDTVGFNESWVIKVQEKFKVEAEKEKRKQSKQITDEGGIDLSIDDETAHTSKFQSYGRNSKMSSSDKKQLSRAKDEGKLNEALLDRRSKVKQ